MCVVCMSVMGGGRIKGSQNYIYTHTYFLLLTHFQSSQIGLYFYYHTHFRENVY